MQGSQDHEMTTKVCVHPMNFDHTNKINHAQINLINFPQTTGNELLWTHSLLS